MTTPNPVTVVERWDGHQWHEIKLYWDGTSYVETVPTAGTSKEKEL